MKQIHNNILVLAAHKSQREGRRISPRTIAEETGINQYTMYALVNNSIKHYPKDALLALCSYFECDLADILFLTDVAEDTSRD